MKLWIVAYTHRHGADVWPRFAVERPSEEDEIDQLEDWEGEEGGDHLEVSGPFDLPGGVSAASAHEFIVQLNADLTDLGFDDPDQEIDGGDFVEYGGLLFQDVQAYLRSTGLPVTSTTEEEEEDL